ncbi:MAG: CHAT domain-containing protein [Deferrisomatales bacterium]
MSARLPLLPLLAAAGLAALALTPTAPRAEPADPPRTGAGRLPLAVPVHEPVQVTAEADPIAGLAVSPDGRWLAYAAGSPGSRDLWLRSADPNRVVLPRRLTSAPGDETAPAFSPDGRSLAYVGTSHDARGDLFLLALDGDGSPAGEPRRLTGREAGAGSPAFARDGSALFFHRAHPGEMEPTLAVLPLGRGGPGASPEAGPPRDLEDSGTGRPVRGASPSVSPDGSRLAFVHRTPHPGGSISLLDLATGQVFPLTEGPALDSAPAWTPEGDLLFVRRELDTDGDGWVTPEDHGVLMRLARGTLPGGPSPVHPRPGADRLPRPYPLTPATYGADLPALPAAPAERHLFFVSGQRGAANAWSLPREGAVPHRIGPADQLALAEEIDRELFPPAPLLAAAAYEKVLERFGGAGRPAARAALGAGLAYRAAGLSGAAETAFARVAADHPGVEPEASLARVRLTALTARRKEREARERGDAGGARAALEEGLRALEAEAAGGGPEVVSARAGVEGARLLLDLGRDADSLLAALAAADRVARDFPGARFEAAEALFLRGEAFGRVGRPEAVEGAYRQVLERYPEVDEWGDRAVERLLDLIAAGAGESLDARVAALRQAAAEARERHPRLAMGALNRAGDLLFAGDEWARAKAAYRQVLDEFPEVATQTAAARLSLAEILYREERFRQALELYEAELRLRPREDRIYRLAHRGYLRRTAEAGAALLRTGEAVSGRSLFRDLLRYDNRAVEGHRGYVQASAALGGLEPVLAEYRARAHADPGDAVALYAVGLALTYRETRGALEEARDWLVRAIGRQGQVEYFHQTLGYVNEVLETVHGERGGLERALEAYRRAAFLNDPEANPANAAHLLLNQGNAAFLLGQYSAADRSYAARRASGIPFDLPDAELLFYRRFGEAAFQVRDPSRAAELYARALGLLEERADPRAASRAYDRLVRAVLERHLGPPAPGAPLDEASRRLAERQSGLRERLFLLTRAAPASGEDVPSPRWEVYRAGVEALLAEQEVLHRDLAARETRRSAEGGRELRESLAHLARGVRDSLRAPLRFAELRAELWDRLALARQEAGQWGAAAEAFGEAFGANRRLGREENLGRNRRSEAYCLYQLAAEGSGKERTALLERSAEGFREARELVRRHGVPAHRGDPGGRALVDLRLEVPLDPAGATQAAFGFSAEQEERLAEAFLARIALELGELGEAEAGLGLQLARYPPGDPVAEGDRFGVSLLAHRAGLLAYARGELTEAFERFARSADLSRGAGGAVSTALNVAGMARALGRLPQGHPGRGALLRELEAQDRRASAALRHDPVASGQPLTVFFHTALGLFWLGEGLPQAPGGAGLEVGAARGRALARAAVHFYAGLRAAGDGELLLERGSREARARAARLHLALARTLEGLGDSGEGHDTRALELARRGLLPDLEWRALAGLGRLAEALAALETVTPLRAHAAPGEIPGTFAPLVEALWETGDPEAAFDLAERLAELERVHRLSPFTAGALTGPERELARASYPRLLRVEELRAQADASRGEERAYRAEMLERERRLLEAQLGPEREGLPALAAAQSRPDLQEAVLVLLGLAVHAEEAAEAASRALDPGEAARRRAEHQELVERFWRLRAAGAALREEGQAPGALALLGPEPATAAELVETLPEGTTLLRAVARPGGGFLLFRLGADAFDLEEVPSLDPSLLPAQGAVAAFENPEAVLAWARGPAPHPGGAAAALSATHWLRSHQARKPLRRSLLVGGEVPVDTPAGFSPVPLPAAPTPGDVLGAAPSAHTLSLPGPVRLASSVPTRAGETARAFPGADLPGGRSVPLAGFVGLLDRASLAVLGVVEEEAVYPAAHLLSLAGCPSVVVPAASPGDGFPSPEAFLRAYAQASPELAAGTPWGILGFGGLSPEDARELARSQFLRYAAAAQAALRAGRAAGALRAAEDALWVTEEIPDLQVHRAELHRFAREAAWAAGLPADAERHAQALVDAAREVAPYSPAHADALLRLGLVQARLERYGEALPALEEAAEMLANLELGPEEVEALASLGAVLEEATRYEQALGVFQTAAERSRDLEQAALLAAQHASLGRVYDLRLNRWARAKQSYEQALELSDAAGDLHGVVQALVDVGRCERFLGSFPAAEERYSLALELLDEDPDPVLRAKVLIEQANNAWFQARYQEAFDLQREAHGLSRESGWALGEVVALNTSGLTWWTLGDHERALRELTRALDRARELPGRDDEVATTLNNLGLVYRETGRFDDARGVLEKALAIDRRLGSRWAVAYDLRNLGLTHLREGDPGTALPLLREAAAQAGDIGDRVHEAKARLALGEALAAGTEGSNDREAREAFEAALEGARSLYLREVEWRALHGLGLLERSAGRLGEARRLLAEAVDVVEGVRAEIRLEQLRDGFLTDKMAVYEALVSVLVALGDPAGAFEVAERSRARNFIDLLGNQRLTLKGAVEQALYDRQAELKARLDEQLALAAQAPEGEERAAYEAAAARLRDEHRDLLLDIQARHPELASLVSVQPLGEAEVRAQLEPGVALLAYYLLEDEVLCWIVRPEGLALVRTRAARGVLEEDVFAYRRLIQNLEPVEALSRALHGLLVDPAAPHLEGVHTLGVIPHGALHYLAFATLSGPEDHVADRWPLFYLPSASVLRYSLERRDPDANRRVLAIGNPDLGDPALELPFAEQEVGTIRWNFPEVTVLTGERATETWVTENLGDFGILHVASHGEFDPLNPLFSALKLVPDPHNDGDLQAAEVFALELRADLVVLSACQTGLGTVTRGDDVLGLNRAFLYAGTHTVVSSLWRVSDVSTAVLMKHFYRQYAVRNKAESLRAALLHVKTRYPHPGYWGAFTLVGDWE